MESIVNPWFIYLLGMVDSLNTIIGVTFVFVCIGLFILIVVAIVATCAGDGDLVKDGWDKCWKPRFYIPLFIYLFLCATVPTKKTLIAMYVANEVTYERAEKAVDITKDLKNTLKKDIIDIIQEVTKEDAKQ
jgi:hypothetical protein